MSMPFDNTYNLSESQLQRLEDAEEMMLKNDLGNAEDLLLEMLEEDNDCILYCLISGTSTVATYQNLRPQ